MPRAPTLVPYRADEVPDGMKTAARNRTRVHVEHLALIDYDLRQLAVNCYLQGVRDMAETVVNRPGLLSPAGPELDYQI